jgi:hypothetical protein
MQHLANWPHAYAILVILHMVNEGYWMEFYFTSLAITILLEFYQSSF